MNALAHKVPRSLTSGYCTSTEDSGTLVQTKSVEVYLWYNIRTCEEQDLSVDMRKYSLQTIENGLHLLHHMKHPILL